MLGDLVQKIAEELRKKDKALDGAMSKARKTRVLSKQAILQIHSGVVKAAEQKLAQAQKLLGEIEEIIKIYPDFVSYDQVSAAHEEYAEAFIIHSLITVREFPEPDIVNVPLGSYILGLGDVPGELRRQALDGLRTGDLSLAEERLRVMENIYLNLISMEEASLLKGLRSKLDIARGVIERTRSEITAEMGRKRLDESVKKLSDKLDEPSLQQV
jgi:translin